MRVEKVATRVTNSVFVFVCEGQSSLRGLGLNTFLKTRCE